MISRACGTLLAAGILSAGAPSSSGLTQLESYRLAETVTCTTLAPRRQSASEPSQSMHFACDGTYADREGSVITTGRYMLSRHEYCTNAKSRTQCYELYVNERGAYFMKATWPDKSDLVEVILVADTPPAPLNAATLHRLNNAEIETLVVGSTMKPIPTPDRMSYEGIMEEHFFAVARPPNSNRGYGVRYDELTDSGSYSIVGDRLCTVVSRKNGARCRALYRLPDGSLAISQFDALASVATKIRVTRH